MTIAPERLFAARAAVPPVVSVIAKAAEVDEGAAWTLLELGLYEALCDEIDRVRPRLEREMAVDYAKRAQGALQTLAKRYAEADDLEQAELESLAEGLAHSYDVWTEVAKKEYWESGDHPRDPATGEFVPKAKGIRQGLLNMLGMATAKPDSDMDRKTRELLAQHTGDSADAYSRMRSLGQGLAHAGNAANNPHAQVAGTALRIAGDVGPEAQRALEPGIRRTAYRYRGTERRPATQTQRDAALLAAYAHNDLPEAVDAQGQLSAKIRPLLEAQAEVGDSDSKTTRQVAAPLNRKAPTAQTLSPMAAALANNPVGSGQTPDGHQLALAADYGAVSLLKQVPDAELARVSLAAGKMPPSVGMLFDADGNLVSEAQGFNGDHYLPFDLKNLKRLKGGSYVRTRTTGGLTDEDVYTGLMTGARQVSVISNSGFFTLEFDPDLRGGRRYSDKARQMVDRYARLTSVIGSESVMQTDLDPEKVAEIRRTVLQTYGADDPDTLRTKLREAMDKARLEATFDEPDDDALQAQADHIARREYGQAQREGGNKPRASQRTFLQTRKEVYNQLLKENGDKQVRAYKLDGDGYGTAMQALEQEFPFFIRQADYIPMREYLQTRRQLAPGQAPPKRPGRDLGYTERGDLAPRGVYAGDKERNAEARSGRKARAAVIPTDAPAEGAAASTPAADGTPSTPSTPAPARPANLPEADAPTFEQAAKQGEARQQEALGDALRGVYEVWESIPGSTKEVMDEGYEETLSKPEDPAIFTQSGGQYAHWMTAYGKPSQYAKLLLTKDPQGKHAEMLHKALDYVRDAHRSTNQRDTAEDAADKAGALLDTLSGSKGVFADTEGNPALVVPNPDDPKPPAFPDVVAAGASPPNVVFMARLAGPDVVAQAHAYDEVPNLDETAVAEIRPLAQKLRKLAEWGTSLLTNPSAPKPSGVEENERGRARALANDPSHDPEFKALETKQKAWALVKANRAAAALTGRDPEPFGDAGPKAVTAAKGHSAVSRVRLLPAGHPVSKALAARASLSALPPSGHRSR